MKQILQLFTRLLPFWTVVFVIFGYFKPSYLIFFKPYLEWMFAFTMLGIGAVLNFEEFLPVFRKPHLVVLGTLTQFTVMPFSAFVVARLFHFSPELTLGLILAGSVPGAMASNVISYLAKADVAYSIAMTSVSTFLSPLLTPALTYIFAHTILKVPFWPMFFSIIKMVIVPLLIGFGLKQFFKSSIEKIQDVFPAISTLFIAFICGLIVALNKNYILDVTLLLFAGVVLHNFIGLSAGYGAGILFGFSQKRRRTLSIEVGMQNAGLGAVLALHHFGARVALPSALFATWCVITASLLAEIWRNASSKFQNKI